eukprot:gene855-147_t
MRPIGVGEILRRIIGKAIAWDLKPDFKEAAGPIQVCAGHQAGAESAIHAMLSTCMLINRLRIAFQEVKQGWLADDASAGGKLESLHNYLKTLITEGQKNGYYVNERKSWPNLKNANQLNVAENIFKDLSIKITTEGQRHLGAALGSESFKKAYVKEKVAGWHDELVRNPSLKPLIMLSSMDTGINLHITCALFRM